MVRKQWIVILSVVIFMLAVGFVLGYVTGVLASNEQLKQAVDLAQRCTGLLKQCTSG
jgi:uncharacterized protein YpmB